MERKHGITLTYEFTDTQQYDKYDVVKVMKSNGCVARVRLYKGGRRDVEILVRDLHIVTRNGTSSELTSVLDCLDRLSQGDPDHLHLPSAKAHLETAFGILEGPMPVAADHVRETSSLLAKRGGPRTWSCSEEHEFYDHIGKALAFVEGLLK